MQYNKIENTDMKVSSIALGTWVFSGDVWGCVNEKDCIGAVSTAFDCGINLIDTAPIYGYGRAEIIVGKAIRGMREKFIIATKCGLVGRGKNIRHDLTPQSIKSEINDSLRRLKTDYIDIYQFHWPDLNTPFKESLEAMLDLKKKGKIKHIGLSNFDVELLKQAADFTGIATSQMQYSLLEYSAGKDVMPFAREQGISVLTYGSLAGGILSGKYNSLPEFKGADARRFFYKYYVEKEFHKVQVLLERLKKMGMPLNQVAINWVRQQPGVASVIVGCRNPEQVRLNASTAGWKLSQEQMNSIESILKI